MPNRIVKLKAYTKVAIQQIPAKRFKAITKATNNAKAITKVTESLQATRQVAKT